MIVYENGNEIIIDESKEIASGGEGRIIQLDSNHVVKLYLPKIKPITKNKFDYLVQLNSDLFIKPLSLIYNKSKQIIGFKMKILSKSYEPIYSFYNLNYCQINQITHDKKIVIIEQLINSVEQCHNNKIVIGDFNPFNIMVDKKNNVKLIDVDSYQIPGSLHSGILLEDIRDYYLNDINEKSDYFALAVISFNLLTHVHPFKGIHPKYGLADRMKKRIPIFSNDKDLKIPKCYKPINDDALMKQFKRIFIDGERFCLNMHQINPIFNISKPTIKFKDQENLIIQSIFSGEIINIKNSTSYLLLQTLTDVHIYNTKQKGIVNLIRSIPCKNDRKYYIHEDNIFYLQNNELYLYNPINDTSYQFNGIYINETIHRIDQYDNILIIITDNKMYQIYLNTINILNNKYYIKFDSIEIYSNAINNHSKNIIQNIGSSQYIFNNYNNSINKIKFPCYIKNVIQYKNAGISQFIKQNSIKFCIFTIEKMSINFKELDINEMRSLIVINDTIIYPEDDNLIFKRTSDFNDTMKIECEYCYNQSELYLTNAGIILKNENEVILLNKK